MFVVVFLRIIVSFRRFNGFHYALQDLRPSKDKSVGYMFEYRPKMEIDKMSKYFQLHSF